METAKRRPALATLLARIFSAWVTRGVLRVSHQNNFAAAQKALLNLQTHPFGFVILYLRVALKLLVKERKISNPERRTRSQSRRYYG